MYKKNTAILGFGIGHFIDVVTGATITAGVPVGKRTLDGVGGLCVNAASYNVAGAIWEIDLAAADTNANSVILSFSLVDCIPISYTLQTTTITLADIQADLNDIIILLTAMPAGAFPAPTISLATIKTILQFETTEYDALLNILIPIIEDIVIKYTGVAAITDLSVGAIFPIAGLIRYAMENPIGARAQTVGSDRTEYGEFPNSLLKLLDHFKPDMDGGYSGAEVLNLTDINEDLGR